MIVCRLCARGAENPLELVRSAHHYVVEGNEVAGSGGHQTSQNSDHSFLLIKLIDKEIEELGLQEHPQEFLILRATVINHVLLQFLHHNGIVLTHK